MTQVSILMLKACQKVAQSPRQERRDNYAPGVLFGKGAVACGLNVCSVVTHLHPRWCFPYGGTWHLRSNSVEIPRVKFISPAHLQVIGSWPGISTQVTALWSRDLSQLLTLLSKQSIRGARETVGEFPLHLLSLPFAFEILPVCADFTLYIFPLPFACQFLLLTKSMCMWHSQLDVVELKSGKLQLELSLQEEINSIFIWNIHTTNYTFIFKTMHTPQNIQTYFHQHICPSKVNSYILHPYIYLFIHFNQSTHSFINPFFIHACLFPPSVDLSTYPLALSSIHHSPFHLLTIQISIHPCVNSPIHLDIHASIHPLKKGNRFLQNIASDLTLYWHFYPLSEL